MAQAPLSKPAPRTLPPKTVAERIDVGLLARMVPVLFLLLSLTLMALHQAKIVSFEGLRTTMADAMTPVMSAVSAPFSSAVESLDTVTTLQALRAENIRLAEENARLREWYDVGLTLSAENKSLRELLNVKSDPSLTFVTARVVSDPAGAFVKSVLLPVGKNDKVEKGNAVMSGKSLIGRVIEVGRHSSRVLLVTDLNSRIPVVLQNTRTRAILAGKNKDLIKLERLPPDTGIAVGARIVTSGDGGQLPADLPIGVIVEVGKDGVWVKPLSDIDRLSYVQVVNAHLDPTLSTGEIE